MNVVVSIETVIPAEVRDLHALVMREVATAAKQTGQQTSNRVRAILVEDERKVTSALLNSVDFDVSFTDTEVTVEIFSTELHAYFIEHGRKPGYVSPEIILEWMMDKGITPRAGETIETAARAIARHITLHGFEGSHAFERALEESVDLSTAAVTRAARRVAARLAA